jgi:lipopolysaccharide/colanic/teichoic acid biosynthesis glycosyltransferase
MINENEEKHNSFMDTFLALLAIILFFPFLLFFVFLTVLEKISSK